MNDSLYLAGFGFGVIPVGGQVTCHGVLVVGGNNYDVDSSGVDIN